MWKIAVIVATGMLLFKIRHRSSQKVTPDLVGILSRAVPSDLYGRSVVLRTDVDGPLVTGRLIDISDELKISPNYRVIRTVDLSAIVDIWIDGVAIRDVTDLQTLPYLRNQST